MVLSCSAYGCNVKFEKGIRFHKFPMNPVVSKAWCIAMHRNSFVPNQHKRLCSKHFTEDCYKLSASGSKKTLKRSAVPTIFDFPKDMSISQVYVDDKIIKDNKSYYKKPRLIMKKPENNQNIIISTSKEEAEGTNGKQLENLILLPCMQTWNNCTIISLPVEPTKVGGLPLRIKENIEKDNTSEVLFDDCSSHSIQSSSSTETAESTSPEDELQMCATECNRTTEPVFTDSCYETNESSSSKRSKKSTEDILMDYDLETDDLEQRTSKDTNCSTSSDEKAETFLSYPTSHIESQQREINFLRNNLRQLRRTVARYRTLVSHLNKNQLISDEVTNVLKWSLS